MTLRTEILAWIMNEVKAEHALLVDVYGTEALPEIESLLDLGVINRWHTKQGTFYEVTKIWAKRSDNGTGSKQ